MALTQCPTHETLTSLLYVRRRLDNRPACGPVLVQEKDVRFLKERIPIAPNGIDNCRDVVIDSYRRLKGEAPALLQLLPKLDDPRSLSAVRVIFQNKRRLRFFEVR